MKYLAQCILLYLHDMQTPGDGTETPRSTIGPALNPRLIWMAASLSANFQDARLLDNAMGIGVFRWRLCQKGFSHGRVQLNCTGRTCWGIGIAMQVMNHRVGGPWKEKPSILPLEPSQVMNSVPTNVKQHSRPAGLESTCCNLSWSVGRQNLSSKLHQNNHVYYKRGQKCPVDFMSSIKHSMECLLYIE